MLHRKDANASAYGQMLVNLDKIHNDLFDYLADEITEHEQLLLCLMEGEKGLSDWDYRENHGSPSESMHLFKSDFQEFKKMVFGYAKKL